MKILNVVGARPNFMKIAPIVEAMKGCPNLESLLVHTGQHYDAAMSKAFFDELGIPEPDINLEVGSGLPAAPHSAGTGAAQAGTHASQTAAIMSRFEPVVLEHKPNLVLVVGDVNSTLACSVTAAKLGVPVAHVEAGLRSFDRTMPEEINRLVTDALSEMLFTTCEDANANLRREGIPERKIFFVGNVMIDTLVRHIELAKRSTILNRFSLQKGDYALVTLHRPSNVDEERPLHEILSAFRAIEQRVPIVFPVHPRTRDRFTKFGLTRDISGMKHLILTEPLGYLDFLNLMMHAKLVLTDSGGIQEETTFLGIPCLTLRENTERPVTITHGTNRLVPLSAQRIIGEAENVLRNGKVEAARIPPLWDGRAAQRIVEILSTYAAAKSTRQT